MSLDLVLSINNKQQNFITKKCTSSTLVLNLRITHDRFGSSSDPSLNGHIHDPNNMDKSLNETVTDKIRKYRVDYNNKPPTTVSFMSFVPSTSGRLHSEFVGLLFLQDHGDFRSSAFVTFQWILPLLPRGLLLPPKSRVGLVLPKAAGLRIMLNIDGSSITSKSHTNPHTCKLLVY